jgi:hypothetical protein
MMDRMERCAMAVLLIGKHQAASYKLQATSYKLQATSYKYRPPAWNLKLGA